MARPFRPAELRRKRTPPRLRIAGGRERRSVSIDRVEPLGIPACTAVSCIGRGLASTLASLRDRRSGLAPCRFETVVLDTYVGEVEGVDDVALPPSLHPDDCRNN